MNALENDQKQSETVGYMVFEKKGEVPWIWFVAPVLFFMGPGHQEENHCLTNWQSEKWSLGLPRWLECEVRNPTKKEATEGEPPNLCPTLALGTYGGDVTVATEKQQQETWEDEEIFTAIHLSETEFKVWVQPS